MKGSRNRRGGLAIRRLPSAATLSVVAVALVAMVAVLDAPIAVATDLAQVGEGADGGGETEAAPPGLGGGGDGSEPGASGELAFTGLMLLPLVMLVVLLVFAWLALRRRTAERAHR